MIVITVDFTVIVTNHFGYNKFLKTFTYFDDHIAIHLEVVHLLQNLGSHIGNNGHCITIILELSNENI